MITKDNVGNITNSPATYEAIAKDLIGGSTIIGWTDGFNTHYDVLFTLMPSQHGALQGGLHGPYCLFVSIMRVGCFGFYIQNSHPLDMEYIAEKMFLNPNSPTAKAVADLINGVLALC